MSNELLVIIFASASAGIYFTAQVFIISVNCIVNKLETSLGPNMLIASVSWAALITAFSA